ncbi:MAG: hypothetical protein ACLTSZ_11285 [Lachnospiraceae bacterium]
MNCPHRQFCAVKAIHGSGAEAVRCAFHESDSICPPTRCVAIAAAPKEDTIRVSTMEMKQ